MIRITQYNVDCIPDTFDTIGPITARFGIGQSNYTVFESQSDWTTIVVPPNGRIEIEAL